MCMEGETEGGDDLVRSTARDYILLWGEEGIMRESGARQVKGMEIVRVEPYKIGSLPDGWSLPDGGD